jgi:hypothetical protein
MQNRTRFLGEEILNLQSNMKEVKELGHNKDDVRYILLITNRLMICIKTQ